MAVFDHHTLQTTGIWMALPVLQHIDVETSGGRPGWTWCKKKCCKKYKEKGKKRCKKCPEKN